MTRGKTIEQLKEISNVTVDPKELRGCEKMPKMYRLEIRVPHIVNNCKDSYERKAVPVFHTWRYKCIAISEDKQALEDYAERLPLEMFYQHERVYKVE